MVTVSTAKLAWGTHCFNTDTTDFEGVSLYNHSLALVAYKGPAPKPIQEVYTQRKTTSLKREVAHTWETQPARSGFGPTL